MLQGALKLDQLVSQEYRLDEINEAFRRGWTVKERDAQGVLRERHVVSKLRVVAVAMENKMRTAAVDRLNDLLARRVIRFRRSIGATHEWYLGKNAAGEGTAMTGSRLLYEIENWSYPIPKAGEVQEQDPDDDTADGADMVAIYQITSTATSPGPRGARRAVEPSGIWRPSLVSEGVRIATAAKPASVCWRGAADPRRALRLQNPGPYHARFDRVPI